MMISRTMRGLRRLPNSTTSPTLNFLIHAGTGRNLPMKHYDDIGQLDQHRLELTEEVVRQHDGAEDLVHQSQALIVPEAPDQYRGPECREHRDHEIYVVDHQL